MILLTAKMPRAPGKQNNNQLENAPLDNAPLDNAQSGRGHAPALFLNMVLGLLSATLRGHAPFPTCEFMLLE
jgi:hypothetical protein